MRYDNMTMNDCRDEGRGGKERMSIETYPQKLCI